MPQGSRSLPNTAATNRSIWKGLGRQNFNTLIDALEKTGFVPGPRELEKREWPPDSSAHALPFAIEKQFADDIAFVAAFEYGVPYVTVACIEPRRGNSLHTEIRLAANEGIKNNVKTALGNIFGIVERCALKDLSREECAESVFCVVVELNRNRILGRIASPLFQRPSHERSSPRERLSIRLKKKVDQYEKRAASTRLTVLNTALKAQINNFHNLCLTLESSSKSEVGNGLKEIVKAAFAITIDGVSLPHRLRKLGYPSTGTDDRDVREMGKLANYWHVCLNLASMSRSYRFIFQSIQLQTLTPFAPSPDPGRSIPRHIHAEVQMIIFYETSRPTDHWPRAIGASKEACFLCDAFVRAHGSFYVSKSHRKIHNLWTVPDLKEYNEATLHRLRRTMTAINKVVTETLRQAKRPHGFQPFPLQSSINLYRVPLPTPSLTTIASPAEHTPSQRNSTDAIIKCLSQLSATEDNTLEDKPSVDVPEPATVPALVPAPESTTPPAESTTSSTLALTNPNPNQTTPSIPSPTPISSQTFPLLPETSPSGTHLSATITTTTTSPQCTRIDWLDLHLELSAPELPDNTLSPTTPFQRASIRIKKLAVDDEQDSTSSYHEVDIAGLNPGEEKVFSRPSDRPDKEEDDRQIQYCKSEQSLGMVLKYGTKSRLQLDCVWHID